MSAGQTTRFRFGGFELNTAERTLRSGGRSLSLPPRAFDTLRLLVENRGRVVSKEMMLAEVWEGSFVEENNLAQNISLLRKVLSSGGGRKFIETVPKFGYRFVAEVEEGEIQRASTGGTGTGTFQRPLSGPKPETRYVRSGDVNIAYQAVGAGPVDVVFVMGWVSHLEYFWEEPHFAEFLNRLASFSRLILFDKRGTGLSDRVPLSELPTLEQRMEDVNAVMDAVGSERAVLIGISEGGPMCSLFAATYPERTTALVMIGSYAKRIQSDDYPWGVSTADREVFYERMQREWGKSIGIEERAPSLASDQQFREWWATYLRMGASPGAAVALTKMNSEIDVRDVLPSIRVPTLVIHRKGDLCLKVEEGRYLASRIPGATFVELGGVDHLPFVGDQHEILDEVRKFLAGVVPCREHDRVLATLLSVKIPNTVDGSGRRRVVDIVRGRVGRFRGHEVAVGRSEILTAFDGPARAVRCAASIARATVEIGISASTGLHTGECDVANGVYSGFAVELARQIADEPEAVDGPLVSRTVKDLVAGSGIVFTERESRSLCAIEGEWQLFSAHI